jgi:hypothetical protein
MRPWIALGIVVLAGAGCHPATAPATTQTWDYEASALTDGQVTCIFGAPMTLTLITGPFSGFFQNGYMSCSGPNGASSTLVTGNVNAGTIDGTAVSFLFMNTDVTNSGEITEATATFTSSGTVTNNGTVMSGTATVNITLGGQPYVLTGYWQANLE